MALFTRQRKRKLTQHPTVPLVSGQQSVEEAIPGDPNLQQFVEQQLRGQGGGDFEFTGSDVTGLRDPSQFQEVIPITESTADIGDVITGGGGTRTTLVPTGRSAADVIGAKLQTEQTESRRRASAPRSVLGGRRGFINRPQLRRGSLLNLATRT